MAMDYTESQLPQYKCYSIEYYYESNRIEEEKVWEF